MYCFKGSKSVLFQRKGRTLLLDVLWMVNYIGFNIPEFANIAISSTPDLGVWHCRFGHLNHDHIS